jgi:2-amino-4-hydroxy-6-hydroxymethyldihydropteridine diphosphokinase
MDELEEQGAKIIARSSFWTSKAWPPDTPAPDYTNAVCQIEPQDNDPSALLRLLHSIEAKLGRKRHQTVRWSSRTLDLDLLDFNMEIAVNEELLILPHPRIGERDFVLQPLLEICPDWVRATDGISGAELLADIQRAGMASATKLAIT